VKREPTAENFYEFYSKEPDGNSANGGIDNTAGKFPPLVSALYVTTVGKLTIAPYEEYPFKQEDHPLKYFLDWDRGRVLNEFQFLFISAGNGRLRSFEGEFPVRPGSLIVLVPGEKYRCSPDPGTGWTEYWIGFSGTTPQEWIKLGLLEKVITFYPILNQNAMLATFEEVVGFARRRSFAFQALAASCVQRIFACLIEDRQLRLDQIDYDIIEKTKTIFDENLYYPLDINELARNLNTNYQNLRYQFREKTGLTPYQYFLQLKINRAKEMLREGKLSIKEISYKLSFDSPYYFSRLFKRKTGSSPSQWNNTTSPQDLDLWK
jgi:AraC-like DNA-binding protein